MSDVRTLYQELILDHNQKPRNFFKMEGASQRAEGYNPLCGDRVTVYVQLTDGVIQNISFEGSGCAISKASASLMTGAVKGKTREAAETLAEKFRELVTGLAKSESATMAELGKLAVFAGVSEFPARVKCATLSWHTLEAALSDQKDQVTTEET